MIYLFGIATIIIMITTAYLVWAYRTNDNLTVDTNWEVKGSETIPEGAVTIRFTGNTTFVITDGKSKIIIDGWFTRHTFRQMTFCKLESSIKQIKEGLARNKVTTADIVFPLHAHYDHIFDSAEVVKLTGAVLMGSPSAAMVGKGAGLTDKQIKIVEDGIPVKVGDFELIPYITLHSPTLLAGKNNAVYPKIEEPFCQPAKAKQYKVGHCYSLVINHPKGSMMIVGSAGYKKDKLKGVKTDINLLCTIGLQSFTQNYLDEYWQETVGQTNPSRVIPIHWDSCNDPIEGNFLANRIIFNKLLMGNTKVTDVISFYNQKIKHNPKLSIMTLPRYDEVVLFE